MHSKALTKKTDLNVMRIWHVIVRTAIVEYHATLFCDELAPCRAASMVLRTSPVLHSSCCRSMIDHDVAIYNACRLSFKTLNNFVHPAI